MTIGDIGGDFCAWDSSGSIAAFTVGNVNCNSGTKVLHWAGTDKQAVFGQNMYRLTEDNTNDKHRFVQIGMAWVKYAQAAPHQSHSACTPGSAYGVCCNLGVGRYLGIGCGDVYSAGYNAKQSFLGPKSPINAVTGAAPPLGSNNCSTGDQICRRLQVHHDDLDATLHPPSVTRYYAEEQWVTLDEATEPAMRNNNPTYREIVVGPTVGACCGTSCDYTIDDAPGSVSQPGTAAIYSWLEVPGVVITEIDVDELPAGQTGRVILAAKATDLGNGLWAYDYALYNMNSHRGVEAFRMCIASGTQISNVGFHDVDYHSGEELQIDTSDWTWTVSGTSILWEAPAPPTGMGKNALRWGTLYNFRFQADQAPDASPRPIALRLFRDGPAGAPSTITEATVVPLGAGCCQANADCGLNQVCCDAECVECCDDSDCPGFGHPYCRLSDHTCICLTNADCGFGGTCFGGSCCFGPAAARPACRARKETLALLIETPLTRV